MDAYEQEANELRLKRRNSISMDGSRNERTEMVVLEMLQPHKNIKKVTIEDYGGTRFPSWIASPLFSNIIYLKLINCRKCTRLPALGQLPSLKDLIVEGMEGIKSIGAEFYRDYHSSVLPFPLLETLKFDYMINWEEWSSSGVEGREDFCCLQKMEILNCPKLKKFSQNFSALRKMRIKWCEELIALPSLSKTDNCLEQRGEFPNLLELSIWTCPNLKELPSIFPSLQVLEISGCQELTELPKLPLIRELELKKCNEGILKCIVGLSSLTYLHLHQIPRLTPLLEGFLQHLTALEELKIVHLEIVTLSNEIGLQNLIRLQRLEISGCPFLQELPPCLHKLSSLKEFKVRSCPSLVCFPETGFPSTLLGLEIKGCDALQLLPEWKMQNNNNLCFPLEYLVIEGCSSLKSFPNGELPSTLKELEIQNCINLESLPKDMIHNNSSLEFLKISGCPSVASFPRGTFGLPAVTSSAVMNLKQLIINDCANLQLLPESLHNLIHLTNLEITQCPLVESIGEFGLPTSMLKAIKVSDCRSLKSLPKHMHSLTSLQELCIESCPSLISFPEGGLPTNLSSLSIMDCANFKPSFEWGLHRLTCLTNLAFGGCQGLVSFPEDWLLPISLSSLQLQQLPNLEFLPNRLNNLTSLDNLEISECDRLQTFSEEELMYMKSY
ncbi:hypothetical protein FF1_028404 [Malus domestica]